MAIPRINPSAETPERIRRNWGALIKGAGASSLLVKQPIAVDATNTLNLNVSSTGGLTTTATALSLKLNTTPGLVLAAGGVSVLLDPTNSCLQLTTGLAVTVNAAGALTKTASGLQVAVDSTTVSISANALRVTPGGIGSSQLGVLSVKGDLLGFSTVHVRVGVGTDGQVLTADAASTPGVKWATPTAPPSLGLIEALVRGLPL